MSKAVDAAADLLLVADQSMGGDLVETSKADWEREPP